MADNFNLDAEFLSSVGRALEVPRQVAVVGAGRWGKVMCDALTRYTPEISTIHLIAERNYPQTRQWLDAQLLNGNQGRYQKVVLARCLDEVLEADEVEVAFVTKMASQHYATARRLLLADKHVLVEKPFVLSPDEAENLIRLSDQRKRALAVGYEFMFSRTMHHFREVIAERLGDISRVHFVWEDRPGDVHLGVPKQQDLSTNIVTDLYPHVLSQLFVLFGREELSLQHVYSRDGYWHAHIELTYGRTPVSIELDKNSASRHRLIAVESTSGDRLELDFTREPGELRYNDTALPQDHLIGAFPESLNLEITCLFAQIKDAQDMPNTAANTARYVEATEAANSSMIAKQTQVLRKCLWDELPETLPIEAIEILRHQMVEPLQRHGLIANPKDNQGLDVWVSRVLRVAHSFSRDPWTTQESVLTGENLDAYRLVRFNAAMRDSDFVQNLILNEGVAHKYWETILPLITTGAIHSVLTNSYMFPLRLGIYAAVSCMFYCSFCGRKPGVRYSSTDFAPGNEIFEQIFAAMPSEISTLSLGGGLEPLTNPKLGDVIRSAKRHGHRVPLVTNAYMLTPKYVRQHESLWDLDIFRISWYGVDEDSYYQTTRRRGAFELVKRNLIELLKERNRRNSNLKIGINFIVLVNTTNQVLKLLDVIGEVNDAVGGRGIDFLTLREDFSTPVDEGLTPEERAMLVAIFAEFNERRQRECPELQVDFGYALYPLSEGMVGKPLAMVTHEGMLPRAYPQVSVAIDLLGDVYLYRDAAFLERPGADRYVIGRVSRFHGLEQVVRDFLESGREIPPLPEDPALMDAFDHVVTKVIWQARSDNEVGIPFNLGPVRDRLFRPDSDAQPEHPMNYWERLR